MMLAANGFSHPPPAPPIELVLFFRDYCYHHLYFESYTNWKWLGELSFAIDPQTTTADCFILPKPLTIRPNYTGYIPFPALRRTLNMFERGRLINKVAAPFLLLAQLSR